MSWWGTDGRELTLAEGIELDVTPVDLPRRNLTHYRLSLSEARVAGDRHVRNFLFEVLRLDDQNIVLACRGDWDPTSAPAKTGTDIPPR